MNAGCLHPYQQEEFLSLYIIYCPQCQSRNLHSTEVLRIARGGHYPATPILKHARVVCGMETYDYYDRPTSSEKYNLWRAPYPTIHGLCPPPASLPTPARHRKLTTSFLNPSASKSSAATGSSYRDGAASKLKKT